MAWIKVPIVCSVEDLNAEEIRQLNEQLENLQLPLKELPETQTEIRQGRLNTKKIIANYPSHNNNRTIVESVGGIYSIALPNNVFEKLVDEAELNNG